MSQVRVLLVDDNDYLLEVVSEWLRSDTRLSIVGTARSGAEAVKLAEQFQADLVLIDATLPDMSGFEATRLLKALTEAPLVVLRTLHDSRAVRLESEAAGADGFIAESDIAECLMPLVQRLVRSDRRYTSVKEFRSPTKQDPSAET